VTARDATLLGWWLVGGGLVACQLVAAVSRGRFPGVGAVLRRLGTSGTGRALLLLGWAWLGWHAFAR